MSPNNTEATRLAPLHVVQARAGVDRDAAHGSVRDTVRCDHRCGRIGHGLRVRGAGLCVRPQRGRRRAERLGACSRYLPAERGGSRHRKYVQLCGEDVQEDVQEVVDGRRGE